MFIVHNHKHKMKFVRRKTDYRSVFHRHYYIFRCVNFDGIDCPYHQRFTQAISIKRFWR